MDGHAPAPGDVPEDAVAGQRAAAPAEPHQHVVDAPNPDAAGGGGAGGRGGRRRRRGFVLGHRPSAQGLHHLKQRHVAVAERGQHLLLVGQSELRGGRAQPLGPQRRGHTAGPAELLLQQVLAPEDVLLAPFPLEPLPDLRPGIAGLDERQPVPARPGAVLVGRHLHNIAGLQRVAQRDEPPVHFRAHRMGPDVGVNAEGEVDRGRAGGEVDDVALGREDEHLVLEQVDLHRVHELAGIPQFLVPLQQLAQPGELLLEPRVGLLAALLVPPVRRDAVLGGVVHLGGPDLDLERLSLADHRGVQGLVAAGFGVRDVVVDFAGDGLPQRVRHPEGLVALPEVVDDHPDRQPVVDAADALPLVLGPLHLLVDAVDMLRPPGDLPRVHPDPALVQFAVQGLHHPRQQRLLLLPAALDLAADLAGGVRLQHGERPVFQLPLDAADPEAFGQGGVNLQGLAGGALLLPLGEELDRPQIVDAVGQLDQDDPDVVGHRQKHLPQVFRLALFAALPLDPAELGDPVHQPGDLRAKLALDLFDRVWRVLRHVVQQRRGDGPRIQPQVGQDRRHRNAVADVDLARGAGLAGVRVLGEEERAADQVEVGLRRQALDAGQQLGGVGGQRLLGAASGEMKPLHRRPLHRRGRAPGFMRPHPAPRPPEAVRSRRRAGPTGRTPRTRPAPAGPRGTAATRRGPA